VLLAALLILPRLSHAQTRDSVQSINYYRLGIMGGITASAVVGSYFYVKDFWWAKKQTTFHFETTKEHYALSMDKASHFFGGTIEADLFAGGFQWSGFDEQHARLYGAIMSDVISFSVEMTDGYAVEHGFSIKDFLCGTAGAWYPYLQYHVPSLKAVNFKWSYWNHVPTYFTKPNLIEKNPSRSFVDNYGNQTYWMTINLRSVAPASWESALPPWLNLAIGGRAGDVVDVIRKDSQFKEFQMYVSLDVDVGQLLPQEGAFWVALRRIVSHVHLPAPAIRVIPNVRVFGFYM